VDKNNDIEFHEVIQLQIPLVYVRASVGEHIKTEFKVDHLTRTIERHPESDKDISFNR